MQTDNTVCLDSSDGYAVSDCDVESFDGNGNQEIISYEYLEMINTPSCEVVSDNMRSSFVSVEDKEILARFLKSHEEVQRSLKKLHEHKQALDNVMEAAAIGASPSSNKTNSLMSGTYQGKQIKSNQRRGPHKFLRSRRRWYGKS